jgi:uncharacterized protein
MEAGSRPVEDPSDQPPDSTLLRTLHFLSTAMKQRFQASLGYLADTGTPKGLGVFASRDIGVDEVVEVTPVIQLKSNYWDLHEQMQQRVYDWARLAGQNGVHALALGYGSMYNHENPANVRYSACYDGMAIAFVAARPIRMGEELTINYNDTGGGVASKEDNWFAATGIVPHLAGSDGA